MKKGKLNKDLLISSILCLIPIVIAIIFYKNLLENIPMHFNIHGEVDSFAPKIFIIINPTILFILNLIVIFVKYNDPKIKNVPKKLLKILLFIIPFMSLVMVSFTIFISLGYNLRIQVIMPILISVIFILIGNYLPKCKRNYTVGIKLPWTLHNDNVWIKTHRLGGFLFVITGVLVLFTSIFLNKISFFIMISMLLIILISTTIYSFVIYKKQKSLE